MVAERASRVEALGGVGAECIMEEHDHDCGDRDGDTKVDDSLFLPPLGSVRLSLTLCASAIEAKSEEEETWLRGGDLAERRRPL